jgi:cytoskeletal protein CcmA (bactofilin family)
MAMLKRDDVPPAPGGDGDLLLGEGAEFDGTLTFKGTVRIDAKFRGSIVTNDVLVVGAHARIDAEITCGTVIVHGEVNGNIRAASAVEIHAPGKVRGDVTTPSLSVERGVVLEGAVRMTAGEEAGTPKIATARAAPA